MIQIIEILRQEHGQQNSVIKAIRAHFTEFWYPASGRAQRVEALLQVVADPNNKRLLLRSVAG
jgi:hypothetical protein